MAVLTFQTTTQFDHGAINMLPKILKEQGLKHPLICTDKGIIAAGILDKVREAIGNEFEITVFDGTPENPTEAAVRDALEIYNAAGCDGLIALGGGSSMDLAKGVGIMQAQGGPMEKHAPLAGGKIGEIVPLVAIPTTSGTGSEVSSGAVIITDEGHKLVFVSGTIIPKVAVCDPDLTIGLPKHLTAATGMDAVTHCIEAFLTPAINPPAEGVALDGLERAVRMGYLKRAVADGTDTEARWHMMMASTEGALAFTKGLGAVHAMAHAAGRQHELRLHHGTLNAVILPVVLRWSEGTNDEKYARLRRAMGLDEGTDIADFIEGLNAELGIPKNLGDMGVTTDMIPGMVEHALTDVCHFGALKKPDAEGYAHLYELAIAK